MMTDTKYVKLVAKPNTWFKEGTEVYDYDANYEDKKRLTLDEYTEWRDSGIICVRGIRINENVNEPGGIGQEREDGESCGLDEFDVEIIDLCQTTQS